MPVVTIHKDLRDTWDNKEDDNYVQLSTEEKKELILKELDTFINGLQNLGDLSVTIKQRAVPITDILIKRSVIRNEQEGFGVKEDGYQATFSVSSKETSEIVNSILDKLSDENIQQAMGREGRDNAEFNLFYPNGKVAVSLESDEKAQGLIERLSLLTSKAIQKQIRNQEKTNLK